jgi:hypothetical protein
MYAMLLSPLGLFHVLFPFDFVFCAEPYGSLPNGNNLPNHADLLQYLLTSFVSAGQRPFIHFIRARGSLDD